MQLATWRKQRARVVHPSPAFIKYNTRAKLGPVAVSICEASSLDPSKVGDGRANPAQVLPLC